MGPQHAHAVDHVVVGDVVVVQREHHDLVAGPGQARGEPVDVGGEAADHERRVLPADHHDPHGRRTVAVEPVRESVVYRLQSVFAPTLGDVDLFLIGEGRHRRLWEALGAHVRVARGRRRRRRSRCGPPTRGPCGWSATGTSWDGRADPLRPLGVSGVWEMFVPGVGAGSRYKFELETARRRRCGCKADPMARAAEVPPDTASIVDAARRTTGATSEWMARRRDRDPLARPAAGLRGAPRLVAARARATARRPTSWPTTSATSASPTWSCCRWPSTPSAARGATRSPATTRRPPASARPTTSATSSTTCTARHRRDRRLGAGPLPARTTGRWPASTAPRSTSTPIPAWASTPTGARWSSTTAATRCATSSSPTPSTGSTSSTSTACGSTRWPRCSTSTTPASRASGCRTSFGGRENLEAIEFIKELNTVVFAEHPGVMMIAEESTSWPMVSRPVDHGGLGFTHKWNMGWMHDTLGVLPARSRAPHATTTATSPSGCSTRSPRTSCCPLSHDEVVHGKGSLLAKMPGDEWQKLRQPAGAATAGCGPTRAASCCSWAARSPSGREWNEEPASTGLPSTARCTAGVQELVRRPEPGVGAPPAPRGSATTSRPGSSGSTPTTPSTASYGFLRWSADGRQVVACVANFTPVPRDGYRVGLPWGGEWRVLLDTNASTSAARATAARTRCGRRRRAAPGPAGLGVRDAAAARRAVARGGAPG